MHAYERYAYEMGLVRGTPMRWLMKDVRLWEIRLWDDLCEKHAYERRAYVFFLRIIIVEKGF
jgi:hypothetical protein